MRLQLPELQAEDQAARKIKQHSRTDGREKIERVLYREQLLYVPEKIGSDKLAGIMTTHWQVHLKLSKQETLLIESIIGHLFELTLKIM